MDFIIDFETLGLRENAAPLNIGIVAFDLGDIRNVQHLKQNSVVIRFDKNEIKSKHFSMDKSTLDWWKSRDKHIRDINLKPTEEDVSIRDGMAMVTNFLKYYGYDIKESVVWSRGLDFDIPKLKHLYEYAGLPYPIRYNCVRDIRTYVDVLGSTDKGFVVLDEDDEKELSILNQHFSVDDCIRDAYMMQYLYAKHFGSDDIPF